VSRHGVRPSSERGETRAPYTITDRGARGEVVQFTMDLDVLPACSSVKVVGVVGGLLVDVQPILLRRWIPPIRLKKKYGPITSWPIIDGAVKLRWEDLWSTTQDRGREG
jgi:hypothetical protein